MISVITATIEGRETMLAECQASIEGQTYPDWQHIVLLDREREGCSVMVNRLADAAEGEWLFLLADDDIALPRCLELHIDAADEADIVYGPPLVWGIHDPWWYFQAPPAIPATALIRRDVFFELGGYDERVKREEDRGLWTRAVEAGARFVRVDEPTWVYRLNHGGNKSLVGRTDLRVAA
jgi:glycosyltransferase involved in cell wall biosynthesis